MSQSAQWAVGDYNMYHFILPISNQPFNAQYQWFNTSDNLIIADATVTTLNSYVGGVYQQATSALSTTGDTIDVPKLDTHFVADQDCYQMKTGCFSTYGFEYKPGENTITELKERL